MKKYFFMSLMSSGLERTLAYRMRGTNHLRLSKEKIEFGVKAQMAAQVGAKANAPDSVIALGALKMMHNICASSCERGCNLVLPRYGYEIHGLPRP